MLIEMKILPFGKDSKCLLYMLTFEYIRYKYRISNDTKLSLKKTSYLTKIIHKIF